MVAEDGSGQFSTIQSAANVAVAGDVVCVRAGTYHEWVEIKNSGVFGEPITFKADPGVVVSYGLSPVYTGVITSNYKNYVTIDGFKTIGGFSGIWTDHSTGVIVRNNFVVNPVNNGIGTINARNALIEGNIVDRGDGTNYHEAIDFWGTDTDGVEVRNNLVLRNVKGEAFVVKEGVRNFKMHHNSAENARVGFYVGAVEIGVDNIEIYNNVARNNKYSTSDGMGFAAASERGGFVQNVNFHDNYAENSPIGFAYSTWSDGQGPPPRLENIQFSNNIAYDSDIPWWQFNLASVNSNNIVSPDYPSTWGYHKP